MAKGNRKRINARKRAEAAQQAQSSSDQQPQPSAQQPSASQPSASQPSASQPPASQPPASQPSAPQPSAPQPSAPQPTAPQPTAPQPSAPQPSAPQPTAPQPTAPQPTAPQPTAPQASARQPPANHQNNNNNAPVQPRPKPAPRKQQPNIWGRQPPPVAHPAPPPVVEPPSPPPQESAAAAAAATAAATAPDTSRLAHNMEQMQIVSQMNKPCARPGYGKAGRTISVEVNFFRMRLPQRMRVSQYAVMMMQLKHPRELEAKKMKKKRDREYPQEECEWLDMSGVEPIFFNRRVFEAVLLKYGSDFGRRMAYDGRSIAYAPGKVNPNCTGHDYKVIVGSEGGPPTAEEKKLNKVIEVRVRVDHVKDMDFDAVTNPQSKLGSIDAVEYLAALDNVLAHSPMKQFVQVGRSFYSPRGAQALGRGTTIGSAWRGFYQSARLSEKGLVVNMDESFTAFWNRGGLQLSDLVRDANDGRELTLNDGRNLGRVASKLKLLKVRAKHTGITYKLHGFSNRSADQIAFDMDGRRVTITEYFATSYKIQLRHSNWPCVKTHPKRDTYLPMEVLYVLENQRMTGVLSPDMTAYMVRIASTKPPQKRKAAVDFISQLDHGRDPLAQEFGMSVENQPMRLNARILPTPQLEYENRSFVNARNGAWRSNAPYYAPAKLEAWLVLYERRALPPRVLTDFVSKLTQTMEKNGIKMTHQAQCVPSENLVSDLDRHGRGGRYMMVVLIKDLSDAQSYNAIKRKGDLEIGVITQVCLAKNLKNPKGLTMYCENLALKINSKLGGQNCRVCPYSSKDNVPNVRFDGVPHMVLGADVTHPMPGGKGASVAALVGSRDREGVQYSASIRNQAGRQEVISDLGNMFKEVYQQWMNNFGNRHHVKHLIMFRDGVSEGQFQEVMTREVHALREACKEVATGCRPLITYIIVTKRHHTKFFPGGRDADRNGNVLPGTVVDRDITSKDFYDFYLNSHAGIQGTSKSSKYTVLVDESKMSPDELQGYIYRLSHGFVRCNRSVSMVNSAYYAHLLAFRGRAYLNEDFSDTASVASTGSVVPPTSVISPPLARRLYFV